MGTESLSIFQSKRLLALIIILVCVASLAGAGPLTEGLAAPGEPVPLVRVDLDEVKDEETFSALGLPVILQLLKPDGGTLVLLQADSDAQERLRGQGFAFEIIDADAQGSYYLLHGDQDMLARASAMTSPLLQVGDQLVVRLDTVDTTSLTATGVRAMPLIPHAYPEPRQAPDAPALPQVLEANPLIDRLLDRVSQDTLYQYVGDLSGEWPVIVNGNPYTFLTRYSYQYTPITRATRFTHDHFESLGIPADYHYYMLGSYERRNVIAQQTGLVQDDRIFLLIAHLDSTSISSPNTNAPGADDNASGSAAVMHIAEILAGYPFGCSLRYVLFTGEEQGLYGSWAYANLMASQDANIVVVLNLDMVAYSPTGGDPVIDLHTRASNETDTELAELFADSVSAYDLNLIPTILNDGLSFSDHYPFWQNHYPGILAIEDWTYHTPYYHTTNDRLSSLNMGYYTEFTKAALATYAHIGCLMEGELGGVVSDALSAMPVSGAQVTVQPIDDEPWTTHTGADGSYTLPLFVGDYTVSVSAPGYVNPAPANAQMTDNELTQLDFSLQSTTGSVYYFPLIYATAP